MDPKWRRWALVAGAALAAAAAGFWALQPQPVPVDTAAIARGSLEVTISEEARTRLQDIYTVSAPIAGTVARSPRQVGDAVAAGETVVATIRPATPALLDARARREAEAAAAAAEATVQLARVQLREADTALYQAENAYTRAAQLRQRNAISESAFEDARGAVAAAEGRLATAEAMLAVREREAETARARLAPISGNGEGVEVTSPIDGQVIAVHHESEQVVSAGTPLIEIADPGRLEVVAELLSADAVRIAVGMPARIDGWGGTEALAASVRRIEPAGFTRVSALGIEEQRVRVLLDFEGEVEERAGLGHGYRVMAHIAVETISDAVLVPLGALFRRGADWSVFVVDGQGRAEERVVEIGERTNREAVALRGLEAGDRVILYPSDRVAIGVAVVERGLD